MRNTMNEQHLKDFESMLATHDWFYHYSDDYSVYMRGHRQQLAFHSLYRSLCKMGLADQADALYDKYALGWRRDGN